MSSKVRQQRDICFAGQSCCLSDLVCFWCTIIHVFNFKVCIFWLLKVPQYVLEDYIERDNGALCNIICTQPRRLSAIGLADRVSKERGQAVGETVSLYLP